MGSHCCPSPSTPECCALPHDPGEFPPLPSSVDSPSNISRPHGGMAPEEKQAGDPSRDQSGPPTEGQRPEDMTYRQLSNSCGIIFKCSNKNERVMIGNCFLISDDLVMTSASNLLESQRDISDGLVFCSSFYDRGYYKVRSRLIPYAKELKQLKENNFCLLKLAEKMKNLEPCQLAYNCHEKIKHAVHFSLHWDPPNLKQQQKTVSISSIKPNQLFSFYDLGCQNTSGSLIAIFHQKQWFIIGMQVYIDQQSNTSFALLFHPDKVLKSLWAFTKDYERKKLKIMDMKQQKIWTFLDYCQLVRKPMLRNEHVPEEITQIKSQEIEKRMIQPLRFTYFGRCIWVNGQPLFYDSSAHYPKKIVNLSEQYKDLTGDQLKISSAKITIPPELPIEALELADQQLKLFQRYLNILNRPNANLDQISQTYLEELKEDICKEEKSPHELDSIYVKMKKHGLMVARFWMQTKYDVKFCELIKKITEKMGYNCEKCQIYDRSGSKIHDLERKICQSLTCNEITINLLNFQCYISSKSIVKAQNLSSEPQESTSGSQKMNLQEIISSKSSFSLLSFEDKENKFKFANIKQKGAANLETQAYLLIYGNGEQQYQLECAGQTFIKTSLDQWKYGKNIQAGDQLLGVKEEDETTLVQYTVLLIEKKEFSQTTTYCCLQIEDTHNFVANNLIIHNKDSITITVCMFFEGQLVDKRDIQVFNHEKICMRFSQYRVFAGGLELNTKLTYGDYQIKRIRRLNIIRRDQKSPITSESLILINMKQTTQYIPFSSIHPMIRKQLKKKLYGIQPKGFKELTDGYRNRLMGHSFPDFLVQEKAIFARKIFYQLYIDVEHQIYLFNKQNEKEIREERFYLKEGIQVNSISSESLHLIYLYANSWSHRLNYYLQGKEPLELNMDSLDCRWSKLLCHVLQHFPKPSRQQIVYTVIQLKPGVQLPIIGENILLLRGFTSTSRNDELEHNMPFFTQHFDHEKRQIKFVIKTTTGRDISKIMKKTQGHQVIILPFTYFYIQEHDTKIKGLEILKLKEINTPKTKKKNLLIWAAENDYNHYSSLDDSDNFERVIISKSLIQLVFEKFLWIESFFGKNIIILTEITEDIQENVKTLNAYKILGLSRKIVLHYMKIVNTTDQTRKMDEVAGLNITCLDCEASYVETITRLFRELEE